MITALCNALVGAMGLEPITPRVKAWYSRLAASQLSYAPIRFRALVGFRAAPRFRLFITKNSFCCVKEWLQRQGSNP